MALTEVSFYNTNGDEVNLSNIVAQMINYYQLKLEVGETAVTDFNEGSEIRNLLEAFAIGIYALLEEQHEATRIAFISTSHGTWLDKIGELPFINLSRNTGNPATGSVTFTIATALNTDYVIPDGTTLQADNGLQFVTVSDSMIYTGDTTCTAIVECLTNGADGNVASGSLTTIIDDNIDTELVSVTNSEAMELGVDYEEDDDYRQRLLENIRADGFGTYGYYKRLCEDVPGVHDVILVDNASYTKKVYVNGDSKPVPDSVIADVVSVLSDNRNHVVGHSFTVAKPNDGTYTTVDLAISVKVKSEMSSSALLANLTAFFDGGNWDRLEYPGLNINQSVAHDDIVHIYEGVIDNIVEVTSIKQSGVEITTLTPATNGVLKLGTVTFTQTEVEE